MLEKSTLPAHGRCYLLGKPQVLPVAQLDDPAADDAPGPAEMRDANGEIRFSTCSLVQRGHLTCDEPAAVRTNSSKSVKQSSQRNSYRGTLRLRKRRIKRLGFSHGPTTLLPKLC